MVVVIMVALSQNWLSAHNVWFRHGGITYMDLGHFT